MFPKFSFSEDRPIFVGRDVEGIKELNATLANKYQLNKQTKIQAEDLLHSVKTLDVDSPIKQEAVKEFEDNLQFIVDNNQYENASQVVENAVTKIKRNEGLRMSGSNYAAYQEYVKTLKDDPKGWTDRELSDIISFSRDQYQGVKYDENGEAFGTFYGYDPGDKVNVLDVFDEALEGFAADQGVTIGQLQDVYNDGTTHLMSTTTKKAITRDEISSYLQNYYNNSPEIQKFYETQSIINSRKTGAELVGQLSTGVSMLNLPESYGTEFNQFLKNNPDTASENTELDYLQWFLGEKLGIAGLEVRQIAEDSMSEDPNIASDAKVRLSSLITQVNKINDIDAAAIKNGYTEFSIKHNILKNDMALYKLKKLEEDYGYNYVLPGSTVSFNDRYGGNAGYNILKSDIDMERAALEAGATQQQEVIQRAAERGHYDVNASTWTNTSNPEYQDYQRMLAEQNAREEELNMLESLDEEATNYAEKQLGQFNNNDVFEEMEAYYKNKAFEQATIIVDRRAEGKSVSPLDEAKLRNYREYRDKAAEGNYEFFNSKVIPGAGGTSIFGGFGSSEIDQVKAFTKQLDAKYKGFNEKKKEYISRYSIKSFDPRNVVIDEFSNKSLQRVQNVVNGHYSNNNSHYLVRDQNGNIVNVKKRPSNLSITGMVTGRFSDGEFYFEATGLDKDKSGKLVPSDKKYYLSATDAGMKHHVGNLLLNNQNPEVVAFGYTLMNTPRYRFQTEKIQSVNDFVPINSKDNLNLGEVRIFSSTIEDRPTFAGLNIDYKVPADIVKSVKDDYEALTGNELNANMNFTSRADFEANLNIIDDLVTRSKQE
jgi:hypothetical protein